MIERFISDLNQSIKLACEKEYYIEVNFLVHQIYDFTVLLISNKHLIKNTDLLLKLYNVLTERIIYIFYNPIYYCFKPEKDNYVPRIDYISYYSSVIGVLLCERKVEGKFSGNEYLIIEEWINKLIVLINKFKSQTQFEDLGRKFTNHEVLNTLKYLYYELIIIGGWTYIFNEKAFTNNIIKVINERPNETIEKDDLGKRNKIIQYLHSGEEITNFIGEKKQLMIPYLMPQNFHDYNKKLFEIDKFSEYLKEFNLK